MSKHIKIFYFLGALLFSAQASAYTANKILFEFLDNGQYRVTVGYTIPALKEYRESYVLFRKKKEAEDFYWKLVRGADFYPDDPKATRFVPNKNQPEPW